MSGIASTNMDTNKPKRSMLIETMLLPALALRVKRNPPTSGKNPRTPTTMPKSIATNIVSLSYVAPIRGLTNGFNDSGDKNQGYVKVTNPYKYTASGNFNTVKSVAFRLFGRALSTLYLFCQTGGDRGI